MPRLYSSAVSCIRLIEDDPNLYGDVVTNAVLYNKNINDALMRARYTGINKSVENFHRFAKYQTNGGLPVSLVNSSKGNVESPEDTLTFIKTIYPFATIIWNAVAVHSLGSYQPKQSNLVGFDAVGMEFMTATGQIGPNYEYQSTTYNGGTSFTVHYTFNSIWLQNIYKTFDKPGFDPHAPYFIVEFGDSIISGNTFVWIYKINSGEFPQYDIAIGSLYLSEHYPVIPIRYDRSNVVDVSYVEPDTRKLLDFFNINLTDFNNSVNDNPDIGKIVDVNVLFAVDINSDSQVSKKYWYELFSRLAPLADGSSDEYDSHTEDSDNDDIIYPNRDGMMLLSFVSDPDAEIPIDTGGSGGGFVGGGFYNPPSNATWNPTLNPVYEVSLSWNYITISTKSGNIVPVGEYTTIFNISPTELDDVQITSSVKFIKQNNNGTYTEILVHGLLHKTTGGKVGETSPIEAGDLSVYKLLGSIVNEDYSFYAPLNVGITEVLSFSERQELYYESLRMVVYAEDSQHIPWYADPGNRLAVSVLVFIVSLITWQPQLNAIYAAGWSYAAAVLIFEMVAVNLLIKAAVDYLVQEYGAENAAVAIFAVISMAYLTGDITGITEYFSAENLLMLVTTFSTGVTDFVNDSLAELVKEAEEFFTDAEEKQEELDEAQDLLGDGSINPFDIIDTNRYFISNETPDEFFTRTVHTGNPGVEILAFADKFVAQALTLPDNVIK